MPDFALNEHVVLITGASGRLGRVMVQRFAAAGARVAAVIGRAGQRDRVPLQEETDGRVFVLDVTDEASVRAGFDAVAGAMGPPHALVHTVGMWAGVPFGETTLDEWETMMRVNLTSTFLCFREAARLMAGRPGRLIAFASGQGVDGGRPEQGAYSASKAGVARLVEAVAAEYRGSGLTAHAVAPSTILFENQEGPGVPAGDLADLCLYLCGPAGDALSGATLRAYGTAR